MKRTAAALTLALAASAAPAIGARPAAAQQGPPPFMEEGATYHFLIFELDMDFEATVLEMGDGPWILVRHEDEGELWLDTSALFGVMVPEEFEEAVRDTRERAYAAAMRSDLRNLHTAQELHYADHYRYVDDLAALGDYFTPSDGVTIELGSSDPANGFRATAEHVATDIVCALVVGNERLRPPATEHGVVACTGGS